MAQAAFIGVDLAWKSDKNPSGVAVLCGDLAGACLEELVSPVPSREAALNLVRKHARDQTVVAVDAPLVVPNATGQRVCETLVGKRYGSRHASCHTSNLGLYPAPASVQFAEALIEDGFAHATCGAGLDGMRVILEVFPHAAMVALFDLAVILKYKKGCASGRREGLGDLVRLIRSLDQFDPPLRANDRLESVLAQDIESLRGSALKHYEDGLDAIFCAYLAYYYWKWGPHRHEMFGDIASGYILNPLLHSTRRCPV